MWISGPAGAVYSVLHSDGQKAVTGVVFVPPFGWDEVESHRARRYWAVRLAAAGIPSLRFDLPGTADSEGGPRDPDLLGRWTTSIATLVSWMREATGVERVAVIGIGVGGVIASRALSEGAQIDDLILWASRASGRQAVRELRAYAGAVASEYPADHENHPVADGVEVTGFLLSDETQRSLSACTVPDMDFSRAKGLRVLLLSRDSIRVDPALESVFLRDGAEVTSLETRDYADLTAHPQSLVLRRPEATVALSIEWLRAGRGRPSSYADSERVRHESGQLPQVTASVELAVGDSAVRETILPIDIGGSRGFAIVTGPTRGERSPVSALLLSPGAIRKIGQHRMWVEVARRWALRGVTTVRFDLPAIGDTAGVDDVGEDASATVHLAELSSPQTIKAIAGVLSELRREGIADKFVTVGHCSGAYLGFHTAVSDPGVLGYFGIDQQIFEYTEAGYQGEMLNMIGRALRSGLLRRLRERGVTAHEMAQVRQAVGFRIRSAFSGAREEPEQTTEEMLDRLRQRGTDILLLLVQETALETRMPEGGVEAWVRRWPNLRVEELPTEDHMARALWLQQLTHERLDAGLERVLVKAAATGWPQANP